jgi:hypothetical protein
LAIELLVVVSGRAIPFDLSPERLQAFRRDRRPDSTERVNKSAVVSIERAGSRLRVRCIAGEQLLDDELGTVVSEARSDARWIAIEDALRGRNRPRGDLRAAISEVKLSKPWTSGLSSVEAGGGCTGGTQLRSANFAPQPLAVTVSCGVILTTIHVTATFLSREEVICAVMHKCPEEWHSGDAWWGEPHVWVDETAGAWGLGYEAPLPGENEAVFADGTLTTLPNCSSSSLDVLSRAWCDHSRQPAPGEQGLIDAAIFAIGARGGICATLAATMNALKAPGHDALKVFTQSSFRGAGALASNYTGVDGFMMIATVWLNKTPSNPVSGGTPPVLRTLQQILAHEADHLLYGPNHADSAGYKTAHSGSCSDMPNS